VSDNLADTRSADPLRRRAEARLRVNSDDIANMSPAEVKRLVYELQVHQMELAVQNEDLQQAQRELSLARDRYRSLYEFAPVGYLALNADRHIVEANLTAESLLGVDRIELIGKHLGDWIHPSAEDDFHRHMMWVSQSHEPQSCELALKRPDGAQTFCRLDSRQREDGTPGFWITLISVTSRILAEEEAEQAKARYEEIVETASGGIWMVDPGAKTTFVNPHMANMLGYTREELLGRSAFELVVDDELDQAHREFEVRKNRDGGEIVEFRFWHKDGSVVHALVNTINLRNPDGSLRGMLATLTDITERKQAQMELNLRVEELRKANDELSRFNQAAVNRELRMIELKKEINELCAQAGLPRRYPLEFEDS
jgi:PAS domain S-box-containing protein